MTSQGAMSAWYLFGAMGLYPDMPGTGQLLVNAPRFESIDLDLGPGRVLRIRAPGADGGKLQYLQSARFDGRDFTRVWLDWEQVRKGGSVDLKLSDSPASLQWGAKASDLPVAACPSNS